MTYLWFVTEGGKYMIANWRELETVIWERHIGTKVHSCQECAEKVLTVDFKRCRSVSCQESAKKLLTVYFKHCRTVIGMVLTLIIQQILGSRSYNLYDDWQKKMIVP